jgi:hypothetical protein
LLEQGLPFGIGFLDFVGHGGIFADQEEQLISMLDAQSGGNPA